MHKKMLLIDIFWPDVSTDRGIAHAIIAGTVALVYGTLSLIFLAIVDAYTNQAGTISTPAFYMIPAALSGCLAWFMWKRQNQNAAILGLVWIASEIALKLRDGGFELNIIILSILMFLSIQGVRGTFAAKRRAKQTFAAE